MKGIFLHYLDRELWMSVRMQPDEDLLCNITNVLTLCTYAPLYSGLSLVCETCYPYPQKRLWNIVLRLIEKDHLKILTNNKTFVEFIDSRKSLYSHDKIRYPMYFKPKQVLELSKLCIPLQDKNVDTSKYLSKQLCNLINTDKNTLSKEESLVISNGINNLDGKAVTIASFKPFIRNNIVQTTGFIERIISTEYTRHYCDFSYSDIVTGIKGINRYDDLAQSFPFLDYTLLSELCKHIISDFDKVLSDNVIYKLLIHKRADEYHREFSDEISNLLKTLVSYEGLQNTPISIYREQIKDKIKRLPWGNPAELINCQNPFQLLYASLKMCISKKIRTDKDFKQHYDQIVYERNERPIRILLCTATDTEDHVLDGAMSNNGYNKSQQGIYISGKINNKLHVQCVRSSMGSVGPSASTLTVYDAIYNFNPKYVISCGIAFGQSQKKQAIGDVLVSEWVKMYEKTREGYKVIDRGDRMPADPYLLEIAKRTSVSDNQKIHIGLLLSGEKLVDRPGFKKKLWKIEPEAIGGEMEGAGIASACYRKHTAWIIVKAICDWGENKNNKHKQEHQKKAAENAMRFTIGMLERIAGDGIILS